MEDVMEKINTTNPIDLNRAVSISLTGGKVTAGYRSAVFDAANRRGMSVNEFVLEAVGSWLKAAMYDFPGVFPGDAETPIVRTNAHTDRSARTENVVQA